MPESEQLVIQQTGLRLNENEELPPPGSLKSCKNISLQKKGVYSSRRGFQWILNPLSTADETLALHQIKHFQLFYDGLIVFTNEGVYFADDKAFDTPPITLESLIRIGDSSNASLFFSQESFYFREGSEMKKIIVDRGQEAKTISENIFNATLEKPPSPRSEELNTTNGWLLPNEAVAYRLAWTRETADGITYRSAPSERLVVQNTETANRSPRFTIIPPEDAQPGDKLEVYRSLPVTLTAGVGTPSDTLFLISTEDYDLTQDNDLTQDYVDTRAGRGTYALYTNSDQEGIANANTPPPLAKVVHSSYSSMTLYADVIEKAAAVFDLEADLIPQDNFILNIGSEQTFTAIESTSTTSDESQFRLVVGDRVKTLENLAFLINSNPAINHSAIAYVIEAEGRVSLGIEALNETSFSVTSNNSKWSPHIRQTQSYHSREKYNRLLFSKAYEPVSVPSSRYLEIGEETARIIALAEGRGELYVFKEDGIFRITGQTFESISVRKIGNDIISGPNAVSFYKNEIYAICNTGVNRIVYENIQEISHDITPVLRAKTVDKNFNLSTIFGDDSKHQLFLAFAADESATYLSEIYVLNFQTEAWTQWEYRFEKALVYGGRLMFLEARGLHWEKKTGSNTDYSDLDLNVRCTTRFLGKPSQVYTDTYRLYPNGRFDFDGSPDNWLKQIPSSYGRDFHVRILSIQNNAEDVISFRGFENQSLFLMESENQVLEYFYHYFYEHSARVFWKLEEIDGNVYIGFLPFNEGTNYNGGGGHELYIYLFYNNLAEIVGEEIDDEGNSFLRFTVTWTVKFSIPNTEVGSSHDCLLLNEVAVDDSKNGETFALTNFFEGRQDVHGLAIFGRLLNRAYEVRIGGQQKKLIRVGEVDSYHLSEGDVSAPLTVLEFEEAIIESDEFYSFLFNLENESPEVINIFRPIEREVVYHNITQGGPTILKLLSHLQLVFNETDTDGFELGLETDTSGTDVWYPLEIERSGKGFGLEVCGTDPWGGSSPAKSYEKISIPRAHRRHYHLGVKWRDNSPNKNVELLGFSLSYEPIPQEEV